MTDQLPLSDVHQIQKQQVIGPMNHGQEFAEECGKCGEPITEGTYYVVKVLAAADQELCEKCYTALKM